jgi:hypothetical protein
MHHDDVGHCAGQGHRREIPIRIERDARIEARIDDEFAAVDEDGIAVRRSLGCSCHSGIAAGMGDVLDVELLAQAYRKFLRDDARDDVGRPGGRERHDHLDRARGILARRFRGSILRKA